MGTEGEAKRGVILVVDDREDARGLLRLILSPEWRVEEAPDGARGLEKARELVPDLVIADWSMPRMPGPEMIRALRSDPNLTHIPVVMLTALADLDHRTESYESGADHFLAKGFEPDELLAIIDRAVQRTEPLTYAAPLMHALQEHVEPRDMAQLGEAVSLISEFQQRMLPPGETTLGDLQVGAALQPGIIASGDFYDYIPWDSGRALGFLVGDVSGRGLAAAYFMVMVRTALRILSRERLSLGETASALNDVLLAETPVGWFTTLFYGVVEPRSPVLRYINAGHCPAVLRPTNGLEQLLEPTGPALGIFEDHAFEEATASLAPGDYLACVTDGVVDAVRTQDLQERYDWIAQVVEKGREAGPRAIASALVEGAVKAAEGGHKDDVTALVLHRTDDAE